MAEEQDVTTTTTTDTDADSLEKFNEPAGTTTPAAKDDAKPAADDKKSDATQTPSAEDKKPEADKTADDGKSEDKKDELTLDSYKSLDDLKEEGVVVDKDALKSLKELALENKWDAETATKIVKIQMEAAKKQADTYKELQKSWEETNKKTYGDNLKNVETNCSRVLTELDKSGKFKELLALAGAEKHPATLEFLKTIGDKLLEKPMVNPNATATTSKEVSLEDFN